MDTTESSAPAHLSTDESPHACLEGVVYIGVLVEQDGEEVEEYALYLCRRCAERS